MSAWPSRSRPHLEPEILVVDEVLAVGDAEFQKKCLGKMDEVSRREGRTVLFVSHNMGTLTSVCSSAMLLEAGRVSEIGAAGKVVQSYLNSSYDRERVEFPVETVTGRVSPRSVLIS